MKLVFSYQLQLCERKINKPHRFLNFVGMRFFLISFVLIFSTHTYAQYTKVRGIIVDSISREPLPFVSISFKGTNAGTISDIDGKYFIESRISSDYIEASFVGYKNKTLKVNRNSFQTINFELIPDVLQLQEIVVKPGENPAHAILRNISKKKDFNNPKKIDRYYCEIYNKIQFDINNLDDSFKDKKIFNQFKFIFENVDTNALTGKAYLPILITETVSDFYYQNFPRIEKEVIKATQISGVRNQSVSQLTGRITQTFNIYDNFMSFYEAGFVSPISDLGLLYYKYYLIDSAFLDGMWAYHISFKPLRKQERTFTGDFWVADTSFAVIKIQMRLNQDANINFINDLVATYQFKSYADSLWYLDTEELLVDFNVAETEKIKGFFGRKYTRYRNYDFNNTVPIEVKKLNANIVVADSAMDVSKNYWEDVRPEKLSEKELKVFKMVDSIKNVPLYRTFADIMNLFVNYYYVLGYIEIGPYFTTYSFNPIEGNRFRASFRTSNKFSKKLMLDGYVAYGTKDERFKFGAGYLYMLNKSPRKAFGGFAKQDMEQLGNSINAFRTDNILSSLLRKRPNYKLTMTEQVYQFYEHEWYQGFMNTFVVNYKRFYPTPYIPFQVSNGIDTSSIGNISTAEFTLITHFAYKEKYVMGEFERMSLGTLYPVFDLFYTHGFKGFLGSQYSYNKLNLRITHYFNTSPFGYFKYTIDAGKIFGKLPYPLLELHRGNETYALDYYAFNMMNYYEFVSDRYASLNAEQHFQGVLFNYIPLIRKLKWREVASVKSLVGSLNAENKNAMIFPNALGEVNLPYTELSIGIENIFKVLRIDAVWRLNYLYLPDVDPFLIKAKLQIIL